MTERDFAVMLPAAAEGDPALWRAAWRDECERSGGTPTGEPTATVDSTIDGLTWHDEDGIEYEDPPMLRVVGRAERAGQG